MRERRRPLTQCARQAERRGPFKFACDAHAR